MDDGQPTVRLLGTDRPVTSANRRLGPRRRSGISRRGTLIALLALVGLVSVSCSSDPAPPVSSPATAAPSGATAEAPQPAAGPRPKVGDCYRLSFEQAGALTSNVEPSRCTGRHTSATYLVGTLDAVSDGHLLAVDSDRVQSTVARRCTVALAPYLGGGSEATRLTMLRPVWFTPTLEEANLGENWFRCDVVALRAEGELLPLVGRLRGVLNTPSARDQFGVCANARPDSEDFSRVACGEPHSWRAVSTLDLGQPNNLTPYPGVAQVRAAGQQRCRSAVRAIADNTLDFLWGYEWPTAEQWRAGRRWGTCWAPG